MSFRVLKMHVIGAKPFDIFNQKTVVPKSNNQPSPSSPEAAINYWFPGATDKGDGEESQPIAAKEPLSKEKSKSRVNKKAIIPAEEVGVNIKQPLNDPDPS